MSRFNPPEPISQLRWVARTIRELKELMDAGGLDLNPYYQRDVVWNLDRQKALLNSIWAGWYVPPVIFSILVEEDDEDLDEDIKPQEKRRSIDGKQRLTTIRKFLDGEIHCDDADGKKWFFKGRADGSSNRRDKFLDEDSKEMFLNKEILCAEYDELQDLQEEEMFSRVQMGMELKTAEKIRAQSGPWQNFGRDIEEKFPELMTISNNTRHRAFHSVLGLLASLYNLWVDRDVHIKNLGQFAYSKAEFLDDAFKARALKIFERYDEVRRHWPHTFSKEGWKHTKTFSPVEFKAVGTMIAKYPNRNAKLLSGDILALRQHIREKRQDLRDNPATWKEMMRFADELQLYRGGPDVLGERAGDEARGSEAAEEGLGSRRDEQIAKTNATVNHQLQSGGAVVKKSLIGEIFREKGDERDARPRSVANDASWVQSRAGSASATRSLGRGSSRDIREMLGARPHSVVNDVPSARSPTIALAVANEAPGSQSSNAPSTRSLSVGNEAPRSSAGRDVLRQMSVNEGSQPRAASPQKRPDLPQGEAVAQNPKSVDIPPPEPAAVKSPAPAVVNPPAAAEKPPLAPPATSAPVAQMQARQEPVLNFEPLLSIDDQTFAEWAAALPTSNDNHCLSTASQRSSISGPAPPNPALRPQDFVSPPGQSIRAATREGEMRTNEAAQSQRQDRVSRTPSISRNDITAHASPQATPVMHPQQQPHMRSHTPHSRVPTPLAQYAPSISELQAQAAAVDAHFGGLAKINQSYAAPRESLIKRESISSPSQRPMQLDHTGAQPRPSAEPSRDSQFRGQTSQGNQLGAQALAQRMVHQGLASGKTLEEIQQSLKWFYTNTNAPPASGSRGMGLPVQQNSVTLHGGPSAEQYQPADEQHALNTTMLLEEHRRMHGGSSFSVEAPPPTRPSSRNHTLEQIAYLNQQQHNAQAERQAVRDFQMRQQNSARHLAQLKLLQQQQQQQRRLQHKRVPLPPQMHRYSGSHQSAPLSQPLPSQHSPQTLPPQPLPYQPPRQSPQQPFRQAPRQSPSQPLQHPPQNLPPQVRQPIHQSPRQPFNQPPKQSPRQTVQQPPQQPPQQPQSQVHIPPPKAQPPFPGGAIGVAYKGKDGSVLYMPGLGDPRNDIYYKKFVYSHDCQAWRRSVEPLTNIPLQSTGASNKRAFSHEHGPGWMKANDGAPVKKEKLDVIDLT